MSSHNQQLPVYGPGRELLQLVSPTAALRLIDEGLAVPAGTKTRIRALNATRDNVDLLRAERLQTGHTYFSHKSQTDDNPKNCWTHKKLPRWMYERDREEAA